MAKTENTAVVDFSDDDLNSADTAEMTVVVNGKPTNWIWYFAGPGHPKTVEHSTQAARERLHLERQQQQAQVNGKKWKAPEESVDEVRDRNVTWITNRLLGWSPVRINGEDFPFSLENARKLLLDQRKGLLAQAVEFLVDDAAFTKRSATS